MGSVRGASGYTPCRSGVWQPVPRVWAARARCARLFLNAHVLSLSTWNWELGMVSILTTQELQVSEPGRASGVRKILPQLLVQRKRSSNPSKVMCAPAVCTQSTVHHHLHTYTCEMQISSDSKRAQAEQILQLNS